MGMSLTWRRGASAGLHQRSRFRIFIVSDIRAASAWRAGRATFRSMRIPTQTTCVLQVSRVYSIPTTKSSTNFLLISHLPMGRSKGQVHPQSRFAMKHKHHRRSDCPINFALETFGDSWSLLIVRDIVYFGKKTYGEFLESDEGIATNILASRLAQLEQKGLLLKKPQEGDKHKVLYVLTEKGLDLIPILLELAAWSAQHDPQTAAPQAWIARVNADKATLKRCIRETVQRGGSIFVGPDSVMRT